MMVHRRTDRSHVARRQVVGALSAGAALLTACLPGRDAAPTTGGAPAREATIQWYQRRSNAATQNLEAGLLEKEWTPVSPKLKVEIVTQPGNNIEATEKLTTMLVGGTPPDLIDNPMSEDNLSPQGLTAPLDDLVARDRFDLNRFVKSHIEVQARFRNKLYGIPYATGGNGYAMVYNRNLFQEAGVPEPAADGRSTWTWDQFRDAVRRLTKTGADNQLSQVGLLNYGYYVLTVPIPWRAQWITPDLKTITCDSPEMIEAYEKLVDLILRDRSTGLTPGADLGGGDPFRAGRAAVRTIGSWQMREYAEITEVDWAFTPLPRARVSSAEFGPVLFSIAAGAKEKDAAWTLLKWLVEKSRFARYSGSLAPIKEDVVPQLREQFQARPNSRWEVMRDAYDTSEPLPFIRRHPAWVDMVKQTDAAWAEMRNGTQAVAVALRALKPSLQTIVDQRPVP